MSQHLTGSYVEAVLTELGLAQNGMVRIVTERDGSGAVTGCTVDPPIDMAGYPAALAAYQAGQPGPAVPASVSRAQAKIALHRAGLLGLVKTAVAADPEVQIWFEDALVWERQNPHVVALGEQLIGDAAGVDALFIAAGQIAA